MQTRLNTLGEGSSVTPFEMAVALIRAGWKIPPYPEPLPLTGPMDEPADSRVIAAAYLHLCDAWEWQVQSLYARLEADFLEC